LSSEPPVLGGERQGDDHQDQGDETTDHFGRFGKTKKRAYNSPI
jgi:hypothetical protein